MCLLDIIKNRYWFLPTKDEQIQMRKEREEIWEKDLPRIKNTVNDLQTEILELEEKIMQSDQAKNFLKLKVLNQKLHFEFSRQQYIQEELGKRFYSLTK